MSFQIHQTEIVLAVTEIVTGEWAHDWEIWHAFYASKVAGFRGAPGWNFVEVRKLPGPDPYYSPRQMYYVFHAGRRM